MIDYGSFRIESYVTIRSYLFLCLYSHKFSLDTVLSNESKYVKLLSIHGTLNSQEGIVWCYSCYIYMLDGRDE